PDCSLELIGIARETQPHETLAAGAERRPGSEPDIRFIDQPHDEAPRVALALDGEEQIERARGLREAHAAGRSQRVARNVASAPRPFDQMCDEAFPALDRRYRGALHKRRDARSRVLDHV